MGLGGGFSMDSATGNFRLSCAVTFIQMEIVCIRETSNHFFSFSSTQNSFENLETTRLNKNDGFASSNCARAITWNLELSHYSGFSFLLYIDKLK